MIKSIELLSNGSSKSLAFTKVDNNSIKVDLKTNNVKTFTLKVIFEYPISLFRNHDYCWVRRDKRCIANWYAPKILKLNNNRLVQANQNNGIWEINKKELNTLYWHFNPKNANFLARYDAQNLKHIITANNASKFLKPIGFLFPVKGLELSRSKIPFSAIACFTDHCDFDTLENLVLQRQFFKKHNIKVTKGFFLNHYSKRKNSASFELHGNELRKWLTDGHELAYHSLSQSVKSLKDSIKDFKEFTAPYENISTWIDHGFQSYNFSMFQRYNEINKMYASHLNKQGIKYLWNYIDSGIAVRGVINQLNPNHFTLGVFHEGIKHFSFKRKCKLFLKGVVFHYYNSRDKFKLYKSLVRHIKKRKKKKSFKNDLKFFINFLRLQRILLPIVLFWRVKKKKIFPASRYGSVVFGHAMGEYQGKVFQSIEMLDFNEALCEENIKHLIEERGLFIAHTYFSDTLKYHKGKLFSEIDYIDEEVSNRFGFLSEKIAAGEIWNPTLQELMSYILKLENISYCCNQLGEVVVDGDDRVFSRKVL